MAPSELPEVLECFEDFFYWEAGARETLGIRFLVAASCNTIHLAWQVQVRQEADDNLLSPVSYRVLARGGSSASEDEAVLREYFNLDADGSVSVTGRPTSGSGGSPTSFSSAAGEKVTLGQLSEFWASRDDRYAAISPYFPGESGQKRGCGVRVQLDEGCTVHRCACHAGDVVERGKAA